MLLVTWDSMLHDWIESQGQEALDLATMGQKQDNYAMDAQFDIFNIMCCSQETLCKTLQMIPKLSVRVILATSGVQQGTEARPTVLLRLWQVFDSSLHVIKRLTSQGITNGLG